MPPVEVKGQVSYAEMALDQGVKDQPTMGKYACFFFSEIQNPEPNRSLSKWLQW